MKFENSILAYEAALQGIGVAMGVHVLVEQYLRSGSMIAPFGPPLPLDDGYYLLIPRGRKRSPALGHFRDWLLEEAARDRQLDGWAGGVLRWIVGSRGYAATLPPVTSAQVVKAWARAARYWTAVTWSRRRCKRLLIVA